MVSTAVLVCRCMHHAVCSPTFWYDPQAHADEGWLRGALVSFLHLHPSATELSAPWAWVHDQQQERSWLLRGTEAPGELCPCGATTTERMLWEPQWCKNSWLWQPSCHTESSLCIGVARAPVVVRSNLAILSSRDSSSSWAWRNGQGCLSDLCFHHREELLFRYRPQGWGTYAGG